MFASTYQARSTEDVLGEISEISRDRKLIFFVDDNFAVDIDRTKSFLRSLIPLKIRWVGQATVNVAFDDELLELMSRSGCQCLLIGFENLNAESLDLMGKSFNLARGDYEQAMKNIRRFDIMIYGTFLFGYDLDERQCFS